MSKRQPFSVKLAVGFLSIVIFLALFADFIANDRPLIALTEEGEFQYFVTLNEETSYDYVIYPPIKFKGGLNLKNTMLKPFETSDHHLGTDHLGRDILAGVIHGGRTSVGISVIAIAIAAMLGVVIGGTAGFLGDHGMIITLQRLVLTMIILLVSYYFLIALQGRVIAWLIATATVIATYYVISKKMRKTEFKLPLDLLSLKFVEVFSAIPVYFLILALVAFVEPNWFLFSVIIGATSWVGIARLIRAEMIKVRSTGYIESAKALGMSMRHIFLRHAIPNAIGPLPYALTFGIASIVVVESTLSYFGVGLPADSLSWGNFLSGFKNNSSAWWVALFPGLMIFFTILSLHIVGRWLDLRFNPVETEVN